MKRIVILGSTGSIGTQTVDVVRQHPEELEIVGLAVNTRVQEMLEQARAHKVKNLAVGDERLAQAPLVSEVREQAAGGLCGYGMDAVVDLVRLPEADVVVNALVGYGQVTRPCAQARCWRLRTRKAWWLAATSSCRWQLAWTSSAARRAWPQR